MTMNPETARLEQDKYSAAESERGAGLAEYGMLLFFILFVCLTIMATVGGTLANTFQVIETAYANLN